MRNTFCIRFYCREAKANKEGFAPVEVSLIVCGERQMWQLPKKCKPADFGKNKDIQLYCTAVENKLNEIYTNLTINDEPITAYIIKDIYVNGNSRKSYTLKNLFDDGLLMKAAENGDPSTYRKYENVIKRFYELTGRNENQEAGSVAHADIILFRNKIESIHQPQTSFKEMQHLKYFFSLAFNSGKIKSTPFGAIKIKKTQVDKPFLTYDEISKIRDLKITNDRLDKVRDIFLFMAFTGLEWADIVNLERGDVKTNEFKQRYIRKPRIKTGVEYVTVLYEDAVEIWDLYNGELPLLSPQKFNKYLKEIAEQAGIEKDITSLTARHTFACYLLNEKKLPIDIVAKMLGHTTTAETKTYAKMFAGSVFEANRTPEGPKRAPTHVPTAKELRQDAASLAEFNRIMGIE